MARDFGIATTAITLSAVWAADQILEPSDASAAFIAPGARHPGRPAFHHTKAAPAAGAHAAPEPGPKGLLAFGMGYGALAACVRAAGRRQQRRASTSRRAGDIEVAEKTETKPVAYLQNIPRTFVEKKTLEKLLSLVPKEQWENPPEDSYLYTLKLYAETYGPEKATKMGWWDFWWMRVNAPDADEFFSGEELAAERRYYVEMMRTGKIPLYIPGPSSLFKTDLEVQWRGPEPFAGDQTQSVVSTGSFALQFLNNLAFYREGLKPWQRGLEIGMAHGYFLIGPFVSLGPLRNTPEAATVGLLAGCATVGMVSLGGLLFGATIKPVRFDKPGDKPGSGFQEMINWHAIGGLGGAGFAHALLTVFGS